MITLSHMPTPSIKDYISADALRQLVAGARAEDLGPSGIDVTSEALIPAARTARAALRPRQAGTLCGMALLPAVIDAYDPRVRADVKVHDGQAIEPGQVLAQLTGSMRSTLALERVALNLLTHLSGIATLTAQYVRATAGTGAKVCDTRKTHTGLRALEKYAVACGGGVNHRLGLYDAVLIKDNHIAHLRSEELGDALRTAIGKARAVRPAPAFVEVEVDSLEQLQTVLPCGPDYVLLDNMNPAQLRQAVAMRDRTAPQVRLEASGGVNLSTVGEIAQTGVDRISVGALTHSAPALDIGLDFMDDEA